MTLFIIRWAFVSRESEGRKDEEKLAKHSERERVCVCVQDWSFFSPYSFFSKSISRIKTSNGNEKEERENEWKKIVNNTPLLSRCVLPSGFSKLFFSSFIFYYMSAENEIWSREMIVCGFTCILFFSFCQKLYYIYIYIEMKKKEGESKVKSRFSLCLTYRSNFPLKCMRVRFARQMDR